MSTEIAAMKQRGRPFKPGQSGNPNGRPKGARNRATLASEALLDGEADALTRKAIELALAGDTMALRLCLERVLPPRKDRPISLAMPTITSAEDAAMAANAVLAAVAGGHITLSEGGGMVDLIDACRRAATPEAPQAPVNQVVRITFVQGQETGKLRQLEQ
jgi:hypothetical protein